MKTGLITSIPKERHIDRRGETLPTAWLYKGNVSTPEGGSVLGLSPEEAEIRAPGAVTLVMLTGQESPALPSLLIQAQEGSRVYVLAPLDWSPRDRTLLECPRMLVRRHAEVPFSAVYTEAKSALWFGSTPGGATPWLLKLDATQAAALRHLFLRLFWYEAQDEGWSDGSKLQTRPCYERPFDIQAIHPRAAISPVESTTPLSPRPGDRLLLKNGPAPTVTTRQLWLPPGGDDQALLSRLRAESEIRWGDFDLPNLRTDGESGEILIPGRQTQWRVLLNPSQAEDCASILDGPSPWSFNTQLQLGELEKLEEAALRVWLPKEHAAQPLTPRQELDLGRVTAQSLREFDATEPRRWPDPAPLALATVYSWEVQPPKAPRGTKEDPLLGQWRSLDADWASRLASLKTALEATTKHRGSLRETFSRLKGALLGFERSESTQAKKLESLTTVTPSALGPEGARARWGDLEDLEKALATYGTELEKAEHKAREDEARESQTKAWEAKVEGAKTQLPEKRKTQGELEEERLSMERQLQEIDESLKGELEKKERKDLKARRHKVSDQLNQLKNKEKRLTSEVSALEKTANTPFVFKAPPQPRRSKGRSKGRFVPETKSTNAAIIPGEALPEVGRLLQHKGDRYLAISTWEELETGETTASRLKARLVAQEVR